MPLGKRYPVLFIHDEVLRAPPFLDADGNDLFDNGNGEVDDDANNDEEDNEDEGDDDEYDNDEYDEISDDDDDDDNASFHPIQLDWIQQPPLTVHVNTAISVALRYSTPSTVVRECTMTLDREENSAAMRWVRWDIGRCWIQTNTDMSVDIPIPAVIESGRYTICFIVYRCGHPDDVVLYARTSVFTVVGRDDDR